MVALLIKPIDLTEKVIEKNTDVVITKIRIKHENVVANVKNRNLSIVLDQAEENADNNI